jgi:hypothetical protein
VSLTVHHYYPHMSGNIGDRLVAIAIRQAVERHFGPAHFVDMPVNDSYRAADRPVGLMGANVDRSNAEADLIVIGGSNLLEPRPQRRPKPGRAQWDWGVFTDADSLARLRPPILLLGMGTGSDFGRPILPYSERAAAQIRLLHERAMASAVRDQTTADRLAAIGVRTVCTGCPVTFFTDSPVSSAEPALPLIVSLPPGRILRKLVGRTVGWLFMRGTARYIAWLGSLGVPVVVTLHEPGDIAVARDWLPASVEVFRTNDLGELIDRYRSSCGVIAFRLHAGLLGLGLGKPIIPAGVDWRGRAFVETFELGHMAIAPGRVGQFRKLRVWTQRLLSGDAELIATLDRAKSRFLGRYHDFLADAATRFSARVRQQ